jgi:DNA-binding CsgD family transcriptional regulator
MQLSPMIDPYSRMRQEKDGIALSRQDLVPDSDWFPSEYHREYHSHTGSEHLLYCFHSLPHLPGHWCALTLTRLAGERDFSPRQKAIVAEVNRLIAPLVGGALAGFTEPSPAELAPRVRAVLACLLEGDSDKQIAARLRLSPYTVNQYVKIIFGHFSVNSRPELLARWIRRGWGSKGGWRPIGL